MNRATFVERECPPDTFDGGFLPTRERFVEIGTGVTMLAVFIFEFLLVGAATAKTSAEAVRLPNVIGDHMVLQSDRPVPIWGWANPGERVIVRFAGQTRNGKAGHDGRWEVRLRPLKASNRPRDLIVSAQQQRIVRDVIVGEVWLGSGQSNMEKPIGEQRGQLPTLNAVDELAKADFPDIRLFKVTRARAAMPNKDVEGHWVRTSPASIDKVKFSAAAYFFGRKLHRELGVPVGLIDSSFGGSRIEPWIPRAVFDASLPLAQWRSGLAAHLPDPQVATMYNGMIAPLAPFAIKGVIWYQGESNIIDYNDGAIYVDKMTALITGWRSEFGQDLSFYYVQVAPHLYHVLRPGKIVSPEAEPLLWEAQTASLRLPKTGMVVTTDLVDDLMNIHPRNKKDVGERLARWALVKDYAKAGIAVSGPLFRSMLISGDKAMLRFDHVDGGLVARDDKALTWFVIAGSDGKFYPAMAVIEGDQVAVSSPAVPRPVAVRFAWDEAARPNFVNKTGLPASPFRTDNPFVSLH